MIHKKRRVGNIPISVRSLSNLKESIIESLENKFIKHANKDGSYTIGRCIAGSFNTEIKLLGYGSPKNTEHPNPVVSVSYEISSIEFPKSYVLKDCIFDEYVVGNSGYSDTGFYKLRLNTDNEILKNSVGLMLESQYLPQLQKKKIAELTSGDKVDLMVISTETFESTNNIICICMYYDGTIPVFELNANFPLDVIGLTSVKHDAYYTVKNGKVVEAKKSSNDQVVSFLTNLDLIHYINFLGKATSPPN